MSINKFADIFTNNESEYLKGNMLFNGILLKYSKSKLKYQLELAPETLTVINVIRIGYCVIICQLWLQLT